MGEARGADHECRGNKEDIDRGLGAGRICGESQLVVESVQSIEEERPSLLVHSAEADLRDGVAGDQKREKDRRDQIGEDQHAVLSDLRIGDALHAAEHGVEEDDAHADEHADLHRYLEEATEHDPHPSHLAGHVSEGHEDGAHDGDDAGRL